MADETPVVTPAPVVSKKAPWLSKTLIVNFVMAVSALAFPPVAKWISAHPEGVMSIFAGVNFILRLVTQDKISISD